MHVKALACELPHRLGLPLSRLSIADIQPEVVAQGLVAEISGTTLWRWLNADALRPWQHRSWIFPRDPDFAAKAGRVLDLYERRWEGVPLRPTLSRMTGVSSVIAPVKEISNASVVSMDLGVWFL